jgi:hypothetical protein
MNESDIDIARMKIPKCETCRRSVIDPDDVEIDPGLCYCVHLDRYKNLSGFCDDWKKK